MRNWSLLSKVCLPGHEGSLCTFYMIAFDWSRLMELCRSSQKWYHEPLPGTFLLHTWSFMFPGMPWISFLPPATLVADVPTGVSGDGDGPGDNDGYDTADADDMDDAEASPVSAWSLPADIFMSLVGLSSHS